MTLTYRPIAGEYRRAIRAAAEVSDVAALERISLQLVDYYEEQHASEQHEPINHSRFPAAGKVAGARVGY